MERARRYAEVILQNEPQAEFILDLGKVDHTLQKIAAAFEELGCKVEIPDREAGKLVVKRST